MVNEFGNTGAASMFNAYESMLAIMSISERIMHRLDKLPGKTQAGLARAMGVSRGAITHIKNGDTKDLRMDNLIAAADYLECEIRWLATGKGPEERRLSPTQSRLIEVVGDLDEKQQAAVLTVAETMLDSRAPARLPPPVRQLPLLRAQ